MKTDWTSLRNYIWPQYWNLSGNNSTPIVPGINILWWHWRWYILNEWLLQSDPQIASLLNISRWLFQEKLERKYQHVIYNLQKDLCYKQTYVSKINLKIFLQNDSILLYNIAYRVIKTLVFYSRFKWLPV